MRLIGRWLRLVNDPAGWRYQLRDARLVDEEPAATISRRQILSAGAVAALAACGPQGTGAGTVGNAGPELAARQLVTGSIDCHLSLLHALE